MSHTVVNYRDVEPVGGGLHFLREPLECANLGVSVREMEPGEVGLEHDHAEKDHEEVFLLVSGEATMVVDDEPVELGPGDAIRVAPAATRQLQNGDAESRFVIAGAP